MSLAKKYVAFQPYRTDLPDFLIAIIDQLIKFDDQQAFSHHLHQQTLDSFLNSTQEHPELVWLYIDVHESSHHISRAPHECFDFKQPNANNSSIQTVTMRSSEGVVENGSLVCNNILANKLSHNQFQILNKVKAKSLNQIRLNCQANIYTNPLEFEKDIRTMFSWSQVYRASSLKSFQYISQMYQKFVTLLHKKDFFHRFFEIKQSDLAKLVRYQIQFKTNCQNWPIIPSSFRQYEEIDRYVSAPPYRAPIINQRLLSKKQPVQCPQNCVCYSQTLTEGKQFCTYSLLNGWESQCPNRSRKVQCNHLDEQKMKLCRNSEIKKSERKRCYGKIFSQGQQPQIEQKLTWGIDLFTRHVLFYCLPQIQTNQSLQKVSNYEKKNHFIEHSLTKAMNLIGSLGYSLVHTCNFIKKYASKQKDGKDVFQKEKLQQSFQKDQQNLYSGLFTSTDYEYADLLIKNYELSPDKTIFRFHTKGKGAICIDKKGIQQGSFIVEYFGQIYQPWRWYDKEDFIKEVLKKKKMKNFIPQFYNIVLEKHVDEPLGYDNLVIDPSRKGNFSSRFSHSCDPNCGTVTTVSDGKYYIGMYSFKNIEYGEQLTFDYCSMTESSFQHNNSICLCGMQKCRGYYLQLSNNKIFNSLMDNRNCFFTRNSAILKSSGQVTPQQLELCAKNNIKQGLLHGTPNWIIKWMAQVLEFIQYEGQVYKQSLIQQWNKIYPWDNSQPEQQKYKKIELYSQTNKSDLINIRFQNLITSVDKLKYFFSRNQTNQNPPIFIQDSQKVLEILVTKSDSILLELQQSLIKYKCEILAQNIQTFIEEIQKYEQIQDKLLLFRLCALVISHNLLILKTNTFNNELLSDIMFFYAFTHTYFSPNNYKPFEADQIIVSLSEILGQKGHPNQKKEKSRKKYSSPFVWGQMASWYKQTIVCPQASLSQDRRGTLSYPIIKSIMQSQYPYEKQSRSQFLKMIEQKPTSSWPPAIGCDLSFKNPFKLYGTLLFENIHSQDKFIDKLPNQSLLQSCMNAIKSTFKSKLGLFKLVEQIMYKREQQHSIYKIVDKFKINFDEQPVISNASGFSFQTGGPRKRIKKESEDSL